MPGALQGSGRPHGVYAHTPCRRGVPDFSQVPLLQGGGSPALAGSQDQFLIYEVRGGAG